MKRSHLFIVAIITMFALSFGMPSLDVTKPIGDCLTISIDDAEAKSYGRSSSRSSFSRSSSKSYGSSKKSSGFSWGSKKSTPAPKRVAPAKKSSFSSKAAPTKSTTYTNSATAKKAPTKAYTNSSGAKAAKTSGTSAKKSAISTAAKTGSSKAALKKYQAPKAGKSGYKSKSGATYQPRHTGSSYSRNYDTVHYANRPMWVNSSPYPGMWTTLLVMNSLNSMERERHMMMMRSDPRYMAFYNDALTNPHMDPALRAQLLATNNMAYAGAGRPVGSSSSVAMIFGIIVILCILGTVITIAVRQS